MKRLHFSQKNDEDVKNALPSIGLVTPEVNSLWSGGNTQVARHSKSMNNVYGESDRKFVEAQLKLAKQLIIAKELTQAIELLVEAEEAGPANRDVHRLLGECLFMKRDWEKSLYHWFKASALTKRNDEKNLRQIRLKVMRCNAQLSLVALQSGNKVLAAESMAQAIEAVDYSVYLKIRPDMVEAVSTYIKENGSANFGVPKRRDVTPRRIAICLDIIKISPVHSHKHLYLSLAASLASMDSNITIDIIATYERQITWNGGFEDYYRPDNRIQLEAFIAEMVPEGIRDRIKVHYFESFGLRGVMETCHKIFTMKHDVILYGSGKRGYHSNESLLVRHVLHEYTPTVFFFVQSNNEVDELNDMIIARGKHPIEGNSGNVQIEYKPYPPFPGLQAAVVPDELGEVERDNQNPIIVTAWVGVRLDKVMNGYSAEDIDSILVLLDKVPGAQWHLVGSEDPNGLFALHERALTHRENGRIVVHPTLNYDEFYEIARNASLFFQTPGITGGGGGASIARNNRVPIICFRHSDVAPMQPEEYVFEEENLAGGVEMALHILTSKEESTKLVDIQIEMMEARRSTAAVDFYACLKTAVKNYNTRASTSKTGPKKPRRRWWG